MSYEPAEMSWQDKIRAAMRMKKKDWNIMVYLGGDNNLEEEMVYALKCMFNVGSTQDVAIYAFFDAGLDPVRFPVETRRERKDRLKLPNARKARSNEGPVTEDHDLLYLSERLIRNEAPHNRNLPMGPKPPRDVKSVQSTLEEFILNSICEAPANHYVLVLSGHGSGGVGDFLGARKRFSGLTIPDLSDTLQDVAECFASVAGPSIYRKMDILGMDSCQMSTAEVAYQVRHQVNFLVGAEGFEPNTGWPYDRMLDSLNENIHLGNEISYASSQAIDQGGGNVTFEAAHEAAKKAAAKIFGDLPENEAWRKYKDETIRELAIQGALKLIKTRVHDALASDKELQDWPERKVVEFAIESAIKMATSIFANSASADFAEIKKVLSHLVHEAIVEALPDKLSDKTISDNLPVGERSAVFPTPRQLAAGVVRQYTHFYASDYTLGEVSTDVSALDLSKMDPLIKQLRGNHGLAELATIAVRAKFAEQIKDAISLSHSEAQGYKDEQNVDLWDFCDLLADRCSAIAKSSSDDELLALAHVVQNACKDVQREIKSLVVLSGYCGPAFQHSHGLSVYFPWCQSTDAAGVGDLDFYATLDFAFGSRWDEFLRAYTTETQRPPRRTRGQVHDSSLNRREGLFLGDPEEPLLAPGDHFEVVDGQIIVRDAELKLAKGEEIKMKNGKITTKDGVFLVLAGHITAEGGALTIGDSKQSEEINLKPENKLTAEHGYFVFNGLPVRDGRLTVRDGRLTVRDGKLTVGNGDTISTAVDAGKQLIVRDGRLTVRDGRLTVRDGRLTVREIPLTLQFGEELTVRDGRLTVRGEPVMVSPGGRLVVREGRLTVRGQSVKLNPDQVLVVNDHGELTLDNNAVRDGRLTVRDGRLTVRVDEPSVRDGRLTVRDGRLTVRGGGLAVRDGRLTVRDGSLYSVRDGRLSVRDGRLTVRDGRLTVRDGRLTVRSGDDVGSVRGGLGLVIKIASMKNPATQWKDCDLIVEKL